MNNNDLNNLLLDAKKRFDNSSAFHQFSILPVALTEDELLEKGKELADTELEIQDLEIAKKTAMDEFKQILNAKQLFTSITAKKIREKSEDREIKSAWVCHHPERNMKTLYRLDNHETVEVTEMSNYDKKVYADMNQLGLDLD